MTMHLTPFRRGRELRNFRSLQDEINDVFDQVWCGVDTPAFTTGALADFAPDIDVSESDDEVRITADLSGLSEDDVHIEVTGDTLTLRGEKKEEKGEKKRDYHLVERSYGSFRRSFTLPPGADVDKAKAEFKKGVMTVTVPKTASVEDPVRKIAIKAK